MSRSDISDSELRDACLSHRHDYGLMLLEERRDLEFQAMEWLRAWDKALALPTDRGRVHLPRALLGEGT